MCNFKLINIEEGMENIDPFKYLKKGKITIDSIMKDKIISIKLPFFQEGLVIYKINDIIYFYIYIYKTFNYSYSCLLKYKLNGYYIDFYYYSSEKINLDFNCILKIILDQIYNNYNYISFKNNLKFNDELTKRFELFDELILNDKRILIYSWFKNEEYIFRDGNDIFFLCYPNCMCLFFAHYIIGEKSCNIYYYSKDLNYDPNKEGYKYLLNVILNNFLN